jgi:tetratricopeptide (TPR) repeat protein
MSQKESKNQAAGKAKRCPHCGKPIADVGDEKPRKWHEKTSVTLCIAAGLAAIGLGFIHIITGVISPFELPFDVVLKESFGYRETFVNAERIKAMPYPAAKIRYPRGCRALQRKGYLQSGSVFETRMAKNLKEDMKKWQEQFEAALGRKSRRWQDRLESYVESEGLDPEGAAAHNNRGITSANAGQYETAISNFTRASQRDPTFAPAYINRGLVYIAIGQLGRAVSDFGKAVEIRPKFVRGHIERGLLHAAMNNHDQAIADFTKAIEIDPTLAEIYLKRSMVCCCKGDYDRAWDDVHKLKNLSLKVPAGYLNYLLAASERKN